jgi:hypothetical protein
MRVRDLRILTEETGKLIEEEAEAAKRAAQGD